MCARTVYLGEGDDPVCPVCSSPLAEAEQPDDDLARRVAQNESAYRSVNEHVHEAAAEDGAGKALYLCECLRRECDDRIPLSAKEYEHVRADPKRFVVAPGHDEPRFEIVTERHGDYTVVEKTGSPGDIAEELDPRSG